MRTHGSLTEDSRTDSLTTPIGKGREGKGSGKGRIEHALATHLQTVLSAFANACRYAESTC